MGTFAPGALPNGPRLGRQARVPRNSRETPRPVLPISVPERSKVNLVLPGPSPSGGHPTQQATGGGNQQGDRIRFGDHGRGANGKRFFFDEWVGVG